MRSFAQLLDEGVREGALEILDRIPSDYQQVDELKAWLRSYIESHTGEVVTYAVFDKTGKLRFVAPNEHDAHMALILSSADPDEFDVATMVKPLYASPVQPDPALTEALTRIEELEGALGFYASVVRYQGPNQRAMPDDKWTDDDAVYRLDVTRDGGAIARATLTQGIKK